MTEKPTVEELINQLRQKVDALESRVNKHGWELTDIRNKMEFSKLKRKRLENGWTLQSLSGLTGISVTYLSNLENEKQANPSLQIAWKLCEAYKTNLHDLFDLSEEEV